MEEKLVSELNIYVANLGVLFVKTHNMHWNVTGTQFMPVHKYLEEMYDNFALTMDVLAEEIKMCGEYPVASMEEMLKISTIEELDSKNITDTRALETLLEDLEILQAHALEIRDMAEELSEFVTVHLVEDALMQLNKNIWFLKATLK